MTPKEKVRWAAHEATAKELRNMDDTLNKINTNLVTLIELIKEALNK
jgi:hypothetical protein